MTTYGALLETLTIFLMMLIPGVILGKTNILRADALPSVNGILLYVAMPALVLSNLLDINIAAIDPKALLLVPLFALLLSLAMTAVGLLVFRRLDVKRRRTACFCAVFSNCGFIGIPLATLTFSDSPEIAGFVSLYNVISCFLIRTLGVLILTGDAKEIKLSRALLNPVVITFAVGVLLSLCGAGERMKLIPSAASMLASLTTPLSMTVLGFEMTNSESLRAALKPSALAVCTVKLIAAPLTVIGGLWVLRQICSVGSELETALFISAAVSTAATAPAMASRYGGDSNSGAAMTVATTVLSLVSFPLMYVLFGIVLR